MVVRSRGPSPRFSCVASQSPSTAGSESRGADATSPVLARSRSRAGSTDGRSGRWASIRKLLSGCGWPMTAMRARVLVLSLGGTIAMSEHGTGAVLDLDAASLVDAVPELRRHADLTARSFRHLPGAHLRLEDIRALATEICTAVRAGEFTGVVVTQGTDTIEETLFALDLLVRIEASVVVTGAMRNASEPGADGPANLLDAVCVASDPAARGLGTVVVLNGEIHAARF